jgi:hypothetical protein
MGLKARAILNLHLSLLLTNLTYHKTWFANNFHAGLDFLNLRWFGITPGFQSGILELTPDSIHSDHAP